MRRLTEVILTVVLIAYSLINFLNSKNSQDLYVLITAIILIIGYWTFISKFIGKTFSKAKEKIDKYLRLNTTETKKLFRTINENKIVRHKLTIKKIWNHDYTNFIYQIFHSSNLIGEYVFDSYDYQFGFEIFLEETNNGKILLIKSHAGAHTQILDCYRLVNNLMFKKIEGGTLGSDWSKITWNYNTQKNQLEFSVSSHDWKNKTMSENTVKYSIDNNNKMIKIENKNAL